MVGGIRAGQPWEPSGMLLPVKIAAVNNAPSHAHGMAIHVFGGGVSYNVGPPLKGAAVYRRGERIVHNQRDAVVMGYFGKTLNIQDDQRRIGQRLRKQ